nr:hypothetical protein [uncultured Desulfobacter sp.]
MVSDTCQSQITKKNKKALIILSAMYWVGADSDICPVRETNPDYGIRPYSLDQTMIKAK